MGPSLIFLCLSLLIASGVFGDEVKSVSVMEGHSVTLHTDVIKQKDDVIMWYYGPENTFVARINGKASSTMFSDDERFKDRLKMNSKTGDLTITHITSQHSGRYSLKIINNNKASVKRYHLTVYGEVSVREGHSVILYTHVLKERDDLIVWTHGPENTLVATIDGKANSIMFSDDERFRGRVKMDDQTGALTINDTRSHHSGLYKISINNKASVKRYHLTVYGEVSVREGHSVILYTHVLKERDDLIVWTHGPENTLVATIDGKANSIMFSDDERFRGRVKMDDQTGALTIIDTRSHHSGLYKISINNKASVKRYHLTVYGEAKSVSVRTGHSVILYTRVLKERDDLIEWHYGPENTLVATIDGKANSIMLSDDERFRGRVKMDDQTGALTIIDTRSHHSGLYKISINKVSYKTFEVTICDVPVLWLCVIPVVGLLLLICVCILINSKFNTCSDRWQKQHKLWHHA